LHEDVRESDLIEQINLVLRDDRLKKDKNPASPAETRNNFILSAVIPTNKETGKSRRFAFVDFNCEEAAKLCIEKLDQASLSKFPGILIVNSYNEAIKNMTQTEKADHMSRTRESRPQFSNLYIGKIPISFSEKDIRELVSQFGDIKSIMTKKPNPTF